MPRPRSVSAVLGSSVPRPRPQPFPSRTRSALRRRVVVGILVLLSLVLITFSFREPSSGAFHGIQTAGATVLRPFEVAAERVARPFRDVYGYFSGLVHAKSENERLRAQINRLRQEAAQGKAAEQDNAEFRAALAFIDGPRFPSGFRPVNARIISTADEFDEHVVISAGSSSGIREDTPIITGDGLVGRVTALTGNEAQVTLLTDDDSAVPALDRDTRAVGLVRHGQGESSLVLDRVTKDRRIRAGDVIVTAGTRSSQFPSLFPRGIVIGTVTSVGQSEAALFKQVQVEPFVDFSSLDTVIALISQKKTPRAP